MNDIFLVNVVQSHKHLYEKLPKSKFRNVHGAAHSFDIARHIASITVFHHEEEHVPFHKGVVVPNNIFVTDFLKKLCLQQTFIFARAVEANFDFLYNVSGVVD